MGFAKIELVLLLLAKHDEQADLPNLVDGRDEQLPMRVTGQLHADRVGPVLAHPRIGECELFGDPGAQARDDVGDKQEPREFHVHPHQRCQKRQQYQEVDHSYRQTQGQKHVAGAHVAHRQMSDLVREDSTQLFLGQFPDVAHQDDLPPVGEAPESAGVETFVLPQLKNPHRPLEARLFNQRAQKHADTVVFLLGLAAHLDHGVTRELDEEEHDHEREEVGHPPRTDRRGHIARVERFRRHIMRHGVGENGRADDEDHRQKVPDRGLFAPPPHIRVEYRVRSRKAIEHLGSPLFAQIYKSAATIPLKLVLSILLSRVDYTWACHVLQYYERMVVYPH